MPGKHRDEFLIRPSMAKLRVDPWEVGVETREGVVEGRGVKLLQTRFSKKAPSTSQQPRTE